MKRTRGWGPWAADWYSACSRHHRYNPDCHLCKQGLWVNRWRQSIDKVVFNAWPELWVWMIKDKKRS